jgi:hypothetical protein
MSYPYESLESYSFYISREYDKTIGGIRNYIDNKLRSALHVFKINEEDKLYYSLFLSKSDLKKLKAYLKNGKEMEEQLKQKMELLPNFDEELMKNMQCLTK